MTTLHTAARQALEALERVTTARCIDMDATPILQAHEAADAAVAALRAALEAQQGWVLVPVTLLQKTADVLEEATTYTGSESWSPSMTDELLALRQDWLAAAKKETN